MPAPRYELARGGGIAEKVLRGGRSRCSGSFPAPLRRSRRFRRPAVFRRRRRPVLLTRVLPVLFMCVVLAGTGMFSPLPAPSGYAARGAGPLSGYIPPAGPGAAAKAALLDSLSQSVDAYATPLQRLEVPRYYDNGSALELVLSWDGTVTAAAERHGVEKEMVQAVFFQELRFLNILDEVDRFVAASFDYLERAEEYARRMRVLPPALPLVFRLDSSTGLCQIFADTAIRAINWEAGAQVYDRENWRDLRAVWTRLRTDDAYNIEMAALVLAHKRSLLREGGNPSPTAGDIMQAYNGTGEQSVRYRGAVCRYYLAFRSYNLAAGLAGDPRENGDTDDEETCESTAFIPADTRTAVRVCSRCTKRGGTDRRSPARDRPVRVR